MDAEEIKRTLEAAVLPSGDREAPSDRMIARLQDLADAGDIEGFAEAWILFTEAEPQRRMYLRSKAVGILVSRYLCGTLGLTGVARWQADHPDWDEDLRSGLRSPAALRAVVDRQAAAIAEASRAAT